MNSLNSEVHNALSAQNGAISVINNPFSEKVIATPPIAAITKPLLVRNNNRSPKVVVVSKDQTIKSIYEMGRIVIQDSAHAGVSPKPKKRRRKNKSPMKEGSIARGLPHLVESAELSLDRALKGGSKSQVNHRRKHS